MSPCVVGLSQRRGSAASSKFFGIRCRPAFDRLPNFSVRSTVRCSQLKFFGIRCQALDRLPNFSVRSTVCPFHSTNEYSARYYRCPGTTCHYKKIFAAGKARSPSCQESLPVLGQLPNSPGPVVRSSFITSTTKTPQRFMRQANAKPTMPRSSPCEAK